MRNGFATAAMLLTSLALVPTACGGGTTSTDGSDSPMPSSEDELRQSSARVYDCRTSDDSALTRFQLELGGTTKAKITDLSKDAEEPDVGTVEPDYHPTSQSYQGASLYEGFSKMLGSSDAASMSLIVSKALKDGHDHERVWVRYAGHGSSTFGYTCDAKKAPIAVDIARSARLSCSLAHLECTHDNPPGDTCLTQFFVQEGEDKASLRLTYLDHFGVRVEERRQAIGNSSNFARTAKKLNSAWPDYSLELDHRAGVTYLGKLGLPGGKRVDVRCSDLAMLDDGAWPKK